MNSSLRKRVATALLSLALVAALMLPASALLSTVKDAVTVSGFAKNTTVSSPVSFSSEDFRVEGNATLDSIVLTALPSAKAGVLTLADNELSVGDVIAMTAVSGMRFYPLTNPTEAVTSFSFTPVFTSGMTGDSVTVGLYLLSEQNAKPIAQDLELNTYRNVALTARFSGIDPEGDLLTYQLMDKPARGAVTISPDDPSVFVYTPYENKTGKDSFTYVAIDSVGNTSEPATVRVKIEKPNTKVVYQDMADNPAHNAAIRLAEEGVFVGECIGGKYYFNASLPVSRSEFVTLAMDAFGIEPLNNITVTGFADDAIIPVWAKGYVSSALKAGAVRGYASEDGRVVFSPNSAITGAEAAVLLNRMLAVSDVSDTSALYADTAAVPTWARQSAVNLTAVGVLQNNSTGTLGLGASLTRGAAAELLAGALDVLESRQTSGWFNW